METPIPSRGTGAASLRTPVHAQTSRPSRASAEFKITANRLTTVFLLLQMKNIRKPGEYSAFQFVPTAWRSPQCVFDRADILYRCETWGGRAGDIFIHGGARPCNDQPWSMCLPQQPPSPRRTNRSRRYRQFGCLVRILTKSNCWKISLSNPQGRCQQRARRIHFSFKTQKSAH